MQFNLVYFFIILQTVLLLFVALHDWINLPPLTNIKDLKKGMSFRSRVIGSIIYFLVVFIPLILTIVHRDSLTTSILVHINIFYGLLTLGAILSWWVPYFFGSSEESKSNFVVYNNTHHFLPKIKDNVIPNSFHVILHLQVWVCFAISIYLLINSL